MEIWKTLLEGLGMNCRYCKSKLKHLVVDLGMSPLANSYLNSRLLLKSEPFYPLRVLICEKCLLVQLGDDVEKPKNIFSNYAYFSSYSETWLKHIEDFTKKVVERFSFDSESQIIEIASNDGYLLQYFKKMGFPILGIEPASNVAKVAKKKGIPTLNKFFGLETAKALVKRKKQADLIIAVNVFPHVPNLIDFILGLKKLLRSNGILIIQFSTYMLPFLQHTYFDSIYHEHFFYFSLLSIQKILSSKDFEIFDVEELPIHGGSLRVFVKHKKNKELKINQNVKNLIKKELSYGLGKILIYKKFSEQVNLSKKNILKFFIKAKSENKKIVCYGAPAKGNTMLNFCGIRKDFVDYTVDISPHKQGLFLPGTHIPIMKPSKIRQTKPDYLVILAWNLKNEIMEQTSYIRKWGGKFVVLTPEVEIYK